MSDMSEERLRELIGEVIDERYCCKRVGAGHPFNHNRQIREGGRCWCTCHGKRK